MPHYMIDLETLDTASTAVITSIGIVEFDTNGLIGEVEYHLDIAQQLKVGRTVSADTLMWWFNQDNDARAILRQGQIKTKYMPDSLRSISHFIKDKEEDRAIVWGNGASFDNVKLASLYESFNMKEPWAYYNDRCYRTLKSSHKNVSYKRDGVHHRAVDDARTQALHLIKINKAAGGVYL